MKCQAQAELGWIGAKYLRRLSFVLIIFSAILGVGCHRPSKSPDGVTVQFEIKPKPVRVGLVEVDFTLTDADGHPVTRAQIAVEADMSHAGMGPVFGHVNEVQPGRYQSHLSLGMAGDWVILLHGALAGGEKLERQFDLREVRPD